MQQLSATTIRGGTDFCARLMLEALPPAMWFIRRHMRRHRQGLSMPQFRALAWVEREPLSCLTDVAELLEMGRPAASRIVSGLVDKGLIRRTDRPADRRQLSLEITERGQTVLDDARAAAHDQLVGRLDTMSDDEQLAVCAAMQALDRAFRSPRAAMLAAVR